MNWQTWRCRCGDNSVSTTLVTLVMVRCLGLAIWHAHLGGWLPACLVLTWPEPTGHLLQLLIRLHPPIMFRQIRLWPQALPPNIVTRMSQRSPQVLRIRSHHQKRGVNSGSGALVVIAGINIPKVGTLTCLTAVLDDRHAHQLPSADEGFIVIHPPV